MWVWVCPTWPSVPFLHPEVAVALGDTCLRIKEGHPDAPLCTQTGIIVVTLLHSVPVILLTQPTDRKTRPTVNATAWINIKFNQRCFFETHTESKVAIFCQGQAIVCQNSPPLPPWNQLNPVQLSHPCVCVCMQQEVLQACSSVIVTLSLQPLSRCCCRPSPRQLLRARREHRLAKAWEIRAQTGVDVTEDETKA